MGEQLYLIWCFERDMYWKPERMGYTRTIEFAGAYSELEAIQICASANINGLEEAMIPVTDFFGPEAS